MDLIANRELMNEFNPPCVIFSTQNGIDYPEDNYIPGSGIMIYEGENSGVRDNHIVPGTHVYWRASSRELSFSMIGVVSEIRVVREWSVGSPAKFELSIEELEVPILVERDSNYHRLTHNTILRRYGIPPLSFARGIVECM